MMPWKLLGCFVAALLTASCGADMTDQEYLKLAQVALDKGDRPSATIQLKNALQQNLNNRQARWLLGKLHLETADGPAAQKELERARELGVVDDSILPYLASAYLLQGKLDEVLSLSTGGLSPTPRAQVLVVQVTALRLQGKLGEAGKKLDRALAIHPDAVEALTERAHILRVKGEPAQAIAILQTLLEERPGYAPARSLLGDLERADKNPQKAETAYSQAIENRPSNTLDLLKRALLRLDLGKYPQAQEDIDLLKQRIPKHFEVNYAQGLLHFKQQQYEQAQGPLELSVRENSQFLPAQFYLGAAYYQTGQLEQAGKYLSSFVSANPSSVLGRKLLAQVRHREGDFAAVEELIRPIVHTGEEDISSLSLLANALTRQGKAGEAVSLFEKAVVLYPDSANARLRLGAVLLRNGENARGVEQLEAALELDPDAQRAYEMLIYYYTARREFSKALAVADAYRERQPELAAPYNMSGTVYLAQGRPQQAKAAFNKARDRSPGDTTANQSLAVLAIEEEDFPRARQYYEEILSHKAGHLDTLMKLADLDEREGRSEDMATHLEQAIASHPEAVQPRTSMARYHLSRGKPGQVILVLGDLLQTQSNNPLVLDVLGRSQLASEASADARSTFRRLVTLQPDSAQAHFLLSQAYGQLGDARAWKAELEKVLELDADHFLARLNLGQLSLSERKLVEVVQHLTVLQRIAPESLDVLRLQAALAQANGEQQQALDVYTRVFEKSPETADMLVLARQMWNIGNREEALALQEQWVTEHERDVSARTALGSAYFAFGRTEDAISQYEEVLEQSGNSAVSLNNLAWHLRDSDPERGLEYAQRASSLAPDSPSVTDTLAVLLMKNGELDQAKGKSRRALESAPENPAIRYHSAMIDAALGEKASAIEALDALIEGGASFAEKAEAELLLAQLRSGR